MTTITLTNDFHHRTATLRLAANGQVSHRTGRRIWQTLCGVDQCICGGQLGERGQQFLGDKRLLIEPDFNSCGNLPGVRAAVIRIVSEDDHAEWDDACDAAASRMYQA